MKITVLLSALLIYGLNSFAQYSGIRDTSVFYDNKMRPALVVNLEADDVKQFKKYVKKYYKKEFDIKFSTSKLKLEAKEFVIPKLSSKELDCIIMLNPVNTDDMTFVMLLRFGYDYYVEQEAYPKEYAVFKDIVKEFAVKYLNDYYKEKLDFHRKALAKAENTRTKLLKQNRKLTKQIAKNDKKIRKIQKRTNKSPEDLQKNDEKIELLRKTNSQNRETVTQNDKTVSNLQKEIMEHNAAVLKIEQKINRIQ